MTRTAVCLAALSCMLGAQTLGQRTKDFLSDEKYIWTSPFRIERKQAPALLLFGGAIAGLIASDVRASNALPNGHGQILWGSRISRTGSSYGVLALSGGLMAAGALKHDSRLKQTGAAAAEAALHSFVVTYALKWAAVRERPDQGSGRGHFWAGYDKAFKGDNSFPSGHSMQAWTVASVISRQYQDKRYVPWLAYGFATAVSASRVAARRHYIGDVAAGAGAGWLLGRMVQGRYAARHENRHAWLRPTIAPEYGFRDKSARVTLSWGL